MTKQEKIRAHVVDMLEMSYNAMLKKVDRAINCGFFDIEAWDENDAPMILPKIIVTAILQDEGGQYSGKGTKYEKKVKRDANKLQIFL